MNLIKSLYRLQFNKHCLLHQYIGSKLSDNHTILPAAGRHLWLHLIHRTMQMISIFIRLECGVQCPGDAPLYGGIAMLFL